MEKRKVSGGPLKSLKQERLVWIGGAPVPATIQSSLINDRVSKVYYVFAFKPITLFECSFG